MNKLFVLISILFFWLRSNGEDPGLIARKIIVAETENIFEKRNDLFKLSNENIIHESVVKNPTILELNFTSVADLIMRSPEYILLTIPIKNDNPIELKLFRTNFFTSDFSIVTSSENEKHTSYKGGIHYWGIVSNDLTSIAAISIFENEVMGMISTGNNGNIILGAIENDKKSRHILYNQNNLSTPFGYNCLTSDLQIPHPKKGQPQNSIASTKCVRLYWEVNYDIYQDKGGTAGATNFITGIFNQSSLIFANDGITVSLAELFIWDKPSPYTNTTIVGMLSGFQNIRTSFNGDIGSLISYGAGGISGNIGAICNPNRAFQQCYCGIVSSYANVPNYSPTIEGITHEQGHLMGSYHTHACVWNGNNTAIDGCGPAAGYPYEGSCSGAPIPSNGGTIMSFCHLNGTGINFSKGFGTQPKNAILDTINSAPCLQTCAITTCDTPSATLIKTITSTTASLEWNPISSALSYNVQYRQIGSAAWITVNVGAASWDLTGLSPNTNYEWRVQTVCSGSPGVFTSVNNFTTIPLTTCDIPSGILTKSITSSSATLDWNPVSGAASYKVQYRRVGFSTWNTINTALDSLVLTGLSSNTSYEWRIQTICPNNTGVYTSLKNFTTLPIASCGIPSPLTATQNAQTSVVLSWTAVAGATNYTLSWKRSSNSSWSTVNNISNVSYNLSGLSSCTSYDYRVRATCSSNSGTYSGTSTFSTTGCALSYCTSRGTSSSYYYINRVSIGSIYNTSGNNSGYYNYSSLNTNVRRGNSYSITLTPSSGSSQKYWNVYVDYNQNGSFQDANEMVASGHSSSSMTLNFTIPSSALLGAARMRVQMKTSSYATNSCTTFSYGEVEDYTLIVLSNSPAPLKIADENKNGVTEKNLGFNIYPDPANDYLIAEIESSSPNVEIIILDLEGRILKKETRALQNDFEKIKIEIEDLKNGIYFLGIHSELGFETRKFIVLKEL